MVIAIAFILIGYTWFGKWGDVSMQILFTTLGLAFMIAALSFLSVDSIRRESKSESSGNCKCGCDCCNTSSSRCDCHPESEIV
ncbi:hypothetical protein HY967_03680 [Candidatus Jorgensenbacteria bacterium]|nr:hypothetical protein [Candidatus Jorgensenbacteria bacterium]